jgi:hypothetical protein
MTPEKEKWLRFIADDMYKETWPWYVRLEFWFRDLFCK